MKYDANTLLLAVQVRELAKELRGQAEAGALTAERAAFEATIDNPDSGKVLQSAKAKWRLENPLNSFLLPAMAELEGIARLIQAPQP